MFWQRVKTLIKNLNTTQEWVSKQIGTRREGFNRWISKNTIPDAEQAYAIAQALGVTVEYLVDGEAGDDYVRKTLGIPEISKERLELIKQIAELPDADIYILSATVAAMVEKTKQVKKIG